MNAPRLYIILAHYLDNKGNTSERPIGLYFDEEEAQKQLLKLGRQYDEYVDDGSSMPAWNRIDSNVLRFNMSDNRLYALSIFTAEVYPDGLIGLSESSIEKKYGKFMPRPAEFVRKNCGLSKMVVSKKTYSFIEKLNLSKGESK